MPTFRPPSSGISPLLSQTATGRWPGGKPWESQPEGGRRFTSQPDQRPTRRYESQPATTGTSNTSRRFTCADGQSQPSGLPRGLRPPQVWITLKSMTSLRHRRRLATVVGLSILASTLFVDGASAKQATWLTGCSTGRVCFNRSDPRQTSASDSNWSGDLPAGTQTYRQAMNSYTLRRYTGTWYGGSVSCEPPEGSAAFWRVSINPSFTARSHSITSPSC
jgi:hypothetical protein